MFHDSTNLVLRALVAGSATFAAFAACQSGQAGTVYQSEVKGMTGLLAYYTFDDVTTSSTTLTDDSGNGHNGAFVTTSGRVPGITTDTPGPGSGQALDFSWDDKKSPVTGISEAGFVSSNAERTAVFWMKSSYASGAYAYLLNFGTRTQDGAFGLYLTKGTLVADRYGGGIATDNSITNDAWHMVAVTVAPTTTGNATWSIYVDGSTTPAATGSLPTNTQLTSIYGAELGGVETGTKYPYRGRMDEIAYFNRILTTEEIETLYTAMAMAVAVPEPGALVMLATGFLGLLVCAWRKRR